jgi:hypothetical protein
MTKRVALKNDHSTKDEICWEKRQKKVNKYKAGGMSHIIDDFLFVEPANSSQCFHDL